MEERSTTNMVLSILSSIIVIVLMILSIIFQRKIQSIIFISLFYTFLITHFILNSIMYGTEDDDKREVLSRISRNFLITATSIISIYLILLLKSNYKWILFITVIVLSILFIIFTSINKLNIIRYILSGIIVFTTIFVLSYLKLNIGLKYISMISIILLYLIELLGNILKNKVVLSLDIISLILFGIFLILK